MKLTSALTLCLFALLGFAQEFELSEDIVLTKFEQSKFQEYMQNPQSKGMTSIYLVDENGNNRKEFEVYLESYSNDGKVYVKNRSSLKNSRKIVKAEIYHCACYCDKLIQYWVVLNDGKWVELPTIEDDDYEFEMKYLEYEFSVSGDKIFLYDFQDEFELKNGVKTQNVVLKSKSLVKTYTWDGAKVLYQ